MNEMYGQLPKRGQRGGGFLYAIKFSNGTVKVGSTVQPRVRFNAHRSDANAFDVQVGCWWLSAEMPNYLAGEDQLIEMAEAMGGRRARREYFHGIDYDDLVCQAKKAFPLITMPIDPARRALLEKLIGRRDDWGERIYTMREVAGRTGFALTGLVEDCKSGDIEHVRIGRTRFMTSRQVTELIRRHVVPAKPTVVIDGELMSV